MPSTTRSMDGTSAAASGARRRFWAWLLTGLAAALIVAMPFVRGLRLNDWLARRASWEIGMLSEPQAAHRVRQLPRLGDAAIDVLAASLSDQRPTVRQAALETTQWELARWRSLPPEHATQRAVLLAAALRRYSIELSADIRPAVREMVNDLLRWPLDRRHGDATQLVSDCEFVLAVLYRAEANLRQSPLSIAASAARTEELRTDDSLPTTGDSLTINDSSPADGNAMSISDDSTYSISDSISDDTNSVAANNSATTVTPPPSAQNPSANTATDDDLQVGLPASPRILDAPPPQSVTPVTPRPSPSLSQLSDLEMLQLLSDQRAEVVLDAAKELQRRGYSSRAITIMEHLIDPDAEVRLQALNELVFVPGLDARPWLWRMMQDPDVKVRRAAAAMLSTTGDPQVLRRLRELESTESDAVILQIIRQARRP